MSSRQGPHDSPRKRPLRVGSELLRELTKLIPRLVELPEGVMVSLINVEVSEDLAHAKVFFSIVTKRESVTGEAVGRLLNAKKGVLRHEIAQHMVMRQHPELRFVYDETPARAARIEYLLKHLPPAGEDDNGAPA